MKEKKSVTRREALETMGKMGLGLAYTPLFMFTLNIQSLAQAFDRPFITRNQKVRITEKALVIGGENYIDVKITGKPGRYCGVAWATEDTETRYKPVPHGRSLIRKDGICHIRIPTKTLPDRTIYLRVITADSRDFRKNAHATHSFRVQLSNGRIVNVVGQHQKILVGSEPVVTVATFGYRRY